MKKGIFTALALLLLMPSAAWATVTGQEDGVDLGVCERVNGASGINVAFSQDTCTLTREAADITIERSVRFYPGSFIVVDNAPLTLKALSLTNSTTPGLALTSGGETTFIEWADGETTPVQVKFKIPADYSSGGAFRVFAGKGGSTGDAPAIDFEVLIDNTGTAADTSATGQTPTNLSIAYGSDSPEQVTLTVATDFGSLDSGDYVTLNLWRDDVDASTEALEVYYTEFYYTASQ